jgi:hypothetical protein
MGGGYDVFCGLPIYFELRQRGYNVHLANYSFSDIRPLKAGIRLTETLVGVTAAIEGRFMYFPELYLAQWFREKLGEDVTIWSFEKTGVRPLIENYHALIRHLNIDTIILIDGGVDSLLRGDEVEVGTILEDTISLVAVNELQAVPVKILCCLGLGAEQDIAYRQIFENIAALTEMNAFLGSCSLVRQMEVYQQYESALLTVQEKPNQEDSVINSSVISAARGNYGDHHLSHKTRGSRLWISPLMPLYWFFEVGAVARRNLLYSQLRYTDTPNEAYRGLLGARRGLGLRKASKIPLP